MSILDEPGSDPQEEAKLEQEMRAVPEVVKEPPPDAPVVEAKEVEEVQEEKEPEPVPTVPLQALNEARHQNRELRQKYSELELKVKQFEEMRQQVEEWRKAQQQAQQQQEFSKDPLGALQKDLQSLKQAQQETAQQQAERERAAAEASALERAVATRVQEFSKAQPDYPDALKFVLETRAKELAMFGVPQEEIENQLSLESLQLARSALTSGTNPAEVVYNLAKIRGYSVKPAKTAPDKVVALERGQKAAQSLSNARGASEETSLLTKVEEMSDEEFDKFWDKEVAGKK